MEARFSGQMHNPILMNSLRLNFMQILKEEDVKCLRKERGNKRIEQSLDLSFFFFFGQNLISVLNCLYATVKCGPNG